DAAYRVLSRDAENMGLSAPKPPTAMAVSQRLWRATARVLGSELGRPARPEEVIDELRAKLAPSWLKSYHTAFLTEIIESAYGPQESRSAAFRPSELAARLTQRAGFKPDQPFKAGVSTFPGLDGWSARHYTPPVVNPPKGTFAYEHYRIDALSAPSD